MGRTQEGSWEQSFSEAPPPLLLPPGPVQPPGPLPTRDPCSPSPLPSPFTFLRPWTMPSCRPTLSSFHTGQT